MGGLMLGTFGALVLAAVPIGFALATAASIAPITKVSEMVRSTSTPTGCTSGWLSAVAPTPARGRHWTRS